MDPPLPLLSTDNIGPLFARSNQSLPDTAYFGSILSLSNHLICSHEDKPNTKTQHRKLTMSNTDTTKKTEKTGAEPYLS